MDMQGLKDFWKKKKWKNLKKSDWAVLGLIGVLLLVIAIPMEKSDAKKASPQSIKEQVDKAEDIAGQEGWKGESIDVETEDGYVEYLEKRMETVLGRIDGVGDVEVMITISDRGEYVVEKDNSNTQTVTTEEDSAGGNRTVSEQMMEETTIYVETEDETHPYIQKEKLPTVVGVVVVAEGGGNAAVISDISESVKALLPVEAHRIKVVKMCSKEE